MRTAHFFAGAGGGLLADLILGHEPVLAVEWVESCCESLRDRAAEGWFRQLHVHCGDIREFDFTPWCDRVDCISAGFPCQDISAAGRGAGISGARSGLVSEVFRAIDAIRPGVVWLENSPRIRTKGRDVVIGELVARGYSWKDGVLAASDVGAGHDRARWWCLAANADGKRQLEQEGHFTQGWRWDRDLSEKVADADGEHGHLGGFHAGSLPQLQKASVPRCKEIVANSLRCERETERRQQVRPRKEERHNAPDCFEETAHLVQQGFQKLGGSGTHKTGCDSAAFCNEASPADALRYRLERAIQCGGLSAADAAAIEAAAGYTGAFHWSPPDLGICGVVDGVALALDGNTKQARIKAAGNGQVPIAAAAAYLILSGPCGLQI